MESIDVHSTKALSENKAAKKIQKFLKQRNQDAEENGAKLNDDLVHQLNLIATAIKNGPIAPSPTDMATGI